MEEQPHKRRLQARTTGCGGAVFSRWRRYPQAWRRGAPKSPLEAPGVILEVGRPVAEIGHLTCGGYDRARSLSWSASTADMSAQPPALDVPGRHRGAWLARVKPMLTMICEDAARRRLWWESVLAQKAEGRKGAAGRVRGQEVFGWSAGGGDRRASAGELGDLGVEPGQIARQDRMVG
jgi:hypothetical protein